MALSIGFHAGHPLGDYFKLERDGDRYRIEKDDLDKRFLATKEVDLYDFAFPFRMYSPVVFDWNAAERKGRVLRIRPDDGLILIAFDENGRQGSLETTFSEGEHRTIVLSMREGGTEGAAP